MAGRKEINLKELRKSLPHGLLSLIAREGTYTKSQIYDAIEGRTRNVTSVDIIELIIERKKEYEKRVDKINRRNQARINNQ